VSRPFSGGLTYSTVESITLDGQNVGSAFVIESTSFFTTVTVNGNGGDDLFIVGTGDLDQIDSPLTVNGGADIDDVIVNDQDLGFSDTFDISSTTVTRAFFAGLVYGGAESLTLIAQSDGNLINVNSTAAGCPVTVDAQGGTDTIDVLNTHATAPVTIAPSVGDDAVNVNTDGGAPATALFAQTQRVGPLTIATGGLASVVVGGDKTLSVTSLSIAGTGRLDLFDNDMIVDYTGGSPLASVQALINLARTGGSWLGNGLTSTSARNHFALATTLGAMEATDYDSVHGGSGALFNGIDPDSSSVLVKYTWYGDTDFNGQVDFDDYVFTDAGLNNGLGGWLNGDNDGSGGVDFDDYVFLDLAFNSQNETL
jgi:hypothetical protein